jgi:large subunit ribosomal protein L10
VRIRLDPEEVALRAERSALVGDVHVLRARLRESDAEYKVVKNTLTRLAARDAGVEIPDEMLTGPTAITFCAGDPVAAAKVLRSFSREHPQLVLKGGVVEGRVIDAAETLRLADLESREEMLARLAGMFQAIVAQPARLAQANLAKAARLFAALAEQRGGEQGGAPADEASTES